jgi:hypothetical protein
MKRLLVLVFALVVGAAPQSTSGVLRLHPSNRHYFEFKGQPTILITSAEHYGAVLNLDFDYIPYLNELQSKGLNNTRTWAGAYCEVPGSFGIAKNTLAPQPGRFICPWARSSTPGYAGGGNKFDLNVFDPAYFARLKDFVNQASARGIVVEMNLFCTFYDDTLWTRSPMNAASNVNGVGNIPRTSALTLGNGALLSYQEAMVRKIVTELNAYDNVYYEVCNEPYIGGVAYDWQLRMAQVIWDHESTLPRRHLISLNAQNNSGSAPQPPSTISIMNWHYADPPDVVSTYYGWNIVIGENETGFDGSSDYEYRKEGWHFIVAGGGLYNNLDYSFTADREDGTDTQSAPGGGSPALRSQLKILKDFMYSFNFLAMAPNNGVIQGGVPSGATARALVQTGEAYAIYISGGSQANLVVNLPANTYRAEWVNTKTGAIDKAEDLTHAGGGRTLASPAYSQDIALRVKRTGAPPPPGSQTFYRGINLNGPALTIDGNGWEGSNAPNYTFNGSSFENQSIALNPATDAARATMIRSSIWNRAGSNVTMTNVPAGRYAVSLYVWEDNFAQTYSISLEGQVVQSNYSSGSGGHWDKLGPWTTDVSDGTIQITCSAGDANLSGLEVWRVSSTPPPTLPVVSVTASDASASEAGSNPGAFTVSRTGSTAQALGVAYSVGGAATPNGDYTALSGTVTIPAGASSATIAINVVNDTIQEPGETVILTISANAAYAVGSPSGATVTIADDDAPPPPPTGQTFYRAINLNGAALTIDGNAWEGSTAANYSFTGSSFANQSIALNPATDANRATMIRSSIWNPSGSNVTMSAVPNGTYVIYLYVWEDNFSQTYSVSLEGQVVQSNYSSGSGGHWDKLGPWTTTIGDGTIQIQCSPGDANLSGLEVWRVNSSPPPPPPTDPALVVHWKLDELSGSAAADASGKGNAGTLSPDGPVWTNGRIGGALDFNGAGDLLSAPASTSINSLKGQMTASLWLYKRANMPTYGSILGRRYGTQWDDLWILFYNNSGADEYSFGVTTTAGAAFLNGPASTGDHASWVHLAAVYDGSSMILYRNGVEVARRAHSGTIPDQSSPVVAGGGDNGTSGNGEYVNGLLDDIRIYNRALSSSEVQGLFSEGGMAMLAGVSITAAPSSESGTGGGGSCGLLGLEAALLLGLLRRRQR